MCGIMPPSKAKPDFLSLHSLLLYLLWALLRLHQAIVTISEGVSYCAYGFVTQRIPVPVCKKITPFK